MASLWATQALTQRAERVGWKIRRYLRPAHTHTLHYRNLKAGDIRVLHILPNTSPYLECRLKHVALSRAPDYIAISYVWGDVEDKAEIIVDGYKLAITRNLYEALYMLRCEGEHESVTVWADAICINQQNTQELSAQVSMMAKVYRNAKYTAARLGPEMETDHLAIELLQHLMEVKDSRSDFREFLTSPHWREHFSALASVFKRDYWERMWIVQEVNIGTSVRIYCGAHWLPWETYRDVSRAFSRFEFDLRGAFNRTVLQDGSIIWSILCHVGPITFDLEEENELLDFLSVCWEKHCSDPKDKLYALLGLLPKAVNSQFRPDYTLSVKSVYIGIVEHILRSTRRLEFLPYATRNEWKNKHSLPSWVPDWSVYSGNEPVQQINSKYTASCQEAQFALALADSSSQISSGSYLSVRPLQLEIKAVFIGTVSQVGLQVPNPYFLKDILMAFLSWRAIIKKLGRTDEREVLCRTITADVVEDWSLEQLTEICFHLFSWTLQRKLPHIPLDDELKACSRVPLGISREELDAFWAKYIEPTCESRRFLTSKEGEVGLSSPNIHIKDVICVPLGCRTPVILRPCNNGKYQFVCDAYIDGYMYGKADTEWETGVKDLQTYVLI